MGQSGEVAEWLNAHAWKACLRKRNGGSNPPLSAQKRSLALQGSFLFAGDGMRTWFDPRSLQREHQTFLITKRFGNSPLSASLKCAPFGGYFWLKPYFFQSYLLK